MNNLLVRRTLYTGAACIASGALYYTLKRNSGTIEMENTKTLPSYQATFSVPMTCDACIRDISSALNKVSGMQSTDFRLSDQLVTTTATAPPSSIVSAIQSTGRTAIIRGTGTANSAAVCILETPPSSTPVTEPQPSPVRGLARLIQLSDRITLLDMTLTGLLKGSYTATIRQCGDISAGAKSMGVVFTGFEGDRKGQLGKLEVDESGRGTLVEEVDWRVWEMVGRGIVVDKVEADKHEGEDDVVVGVIARSAGVWENEKVVCGCSGKTVWEEREEMLGRGML